MQLTTEDLQTTGADRAAFRRAADRDGRPGSDLPYRGGAKESSTLKHILVVEDDPTCRELVARILAKAGFHAETARDGEEGWSALCVATFDLLITDNDMPRLTGLNLIRRLRAVSGKPPCILISGSLPGPESTLRDIVHPGSILAKPFTCVALIEEVFGLLLRGEF